MIVRRSRRKSRRGGVLIACLAIVMTMAAMSAMLLQIESSRARQQLFGADQKRALNIAEAGLSEAYFAIAAGKSGSVGTREAPARFGDGLFWVVAEEAESGLISLESTGMCGFGRATLGLVVRRQPVSVASLGVLGAERVEMGNRSRVDAYDSRESAAPTGDAPLSSSFRVQSNSDIVLGSLAKVLGDATPGPDGSVLLGTSATVTGATTPSPTSVNLPPIETPVLPMKAYAAPVLPGTVTLPAADAGYARVDVPALSKLVIEGPATISIEKLSVQATASLDFDTTNGPITLYVKDWLRLASGANVTFSHRDPKKVSMLVAASEVANHDGDALGIKEQPLEFDYSGVFYGSLYAPQAEVSLAPGFELFGTVAARSLTLGQSAQVHFDVALENESSGDVSAVQKLSWRVIEVPTEVARNMAPDPFAALGVDASTLDKPAEAHKDEAYQIHIMYLDQFGVQQTYRGPEAGFDWSLVDTVIKLLRAPL